MRAFLIFSVTTLWLLGCTMTLASEQDARAIIERAVEAQGGEVQVTKLTKVWRAEVKASRRNVAFIGKMAYQSPNQMKIETTIEMNARKTVVVAVLNGDKGWQSVNGQTREVTGKELEEMRDGAYRSRRVRFLENGKLDSVEEITEMKFVDRIDDEEFAKP